MPNKYITDLAESFSNIKMGFKNESLLMRFIGKLLFFNPNFMTTYVTTIGNTIYVPSREWLDAQKIGIVEIFFHEYQHIQDSKKFKALYTVMYLFPAILFPILAILAIVLHSYILLLFGLVCLAPLPAPGRTYFEFRGYVMSLFVSSLLLKRMGLDEASIARHLNESATRYDKQFTSFAYYVMWPFGLTKQFKAKIQKITDGTLIDSDVTFKIVAMAINSIDDQS